MDRPPLTIRAASFPEDAPTARQLLREYGETPGVLECVRGFSAELDSLPGRYAAEEGGRLLIATVGGTPAGCGALRRISDGICEMKRLYIAPASRGAGVGRQLALALIDAAREAGYRTMRLDTLPSMVPAIALYRSLGFLSIDRYNPDAPVQALFFQLDL